MSAPAEDGASALDRALERLPRLALVVGKGGVGKTTCAAALATRAAARGEETLLLSTDPARTLGVAVGAPLGHEPAAVPGRPGLYAMQLDAEAARAAFLARWRRTIVTIVDRGTYLDLDDIEGLVDAALPGADEAMALLVLADLAADERWRRVVADTAPTGHTLRLLALPGVFRALVTLLDTMQEKHRFMVSALTHRYRADEADAFIGEMRARVERFERTLADPALTAAVIVSRPEAVVAAETERLATSLAALGTAVAVVVENAVPRERDAESAGALERLRAVAPGALRVHVEDIGALVPGPDGIARWSRAATTGSSGGARDAAAGKEAIQAAGNRWGATGATDPASPQGGAPGAARDREERRPADSTTPAPPDASETSETSVATALLRPLTIVGGKGGVGKTTIACALAIAAAVDRRVLLVSTDPAPSVADALVVAIGDEETPVPGVPGLVARQMDAAAAFDRLRTGYQARIDGIFDGLLGGGMDATHDRRVLRDLLSLAPPGVDEVYALGVLGETLAEGRFDVVVVDPAPTGHLLRLLEMPALALEWSHRLLRLMLKYREVAGLGEAAAEVLAFAKRTRLVGEMLRDPARSGLVCAALDEPLVRDETLRLADAVIRLGVPMAGIVWNRARGAVAPLTTGGGVPQFAAGEALPPPRGAAVLRRWLRDWRPIRDA